MGQRRLTFKAFLSVLALLLPFAISAQTVTGTITDGANGDPLIIVEGLFVRIPGNNLVKARSSSWRRTQKNRFWILSIGSLWIWPGEYIS